MDPINAIGIVTTLIMSVWKLYGFIKRKKITQAYTQADKTLDILCSAIEIVEPNSKISKQIKKVIEYLATGADLNDELTKRVREIEAYFKENNEHAIDLESRKKRAMEAIAAVREVRNKKGGTK